ncbi:MAG: iron ABC transporter permease [Candidatus Thorarchaeota archaeon]|nr:MAG: iron ABC transporter permease [Candidatus Thorarchaeota archaeon]
MIKQEYWTYIVLAFPIILLSIFLVFPVLSVIMLGLTSGTGNSFIGTLSAYDNQFTIAFTFIQAIISTILALLVGIPGAMLLARLRFRGKSLIRALIIVPFVLPPIAVVVGFLQMFGSYGIIDSALMWLTQSSTSILNLAEGFVGIILAHTFYNAPLVILLVSASMERLNPEIEESAEILGADSFSRFRRITLPHILPALSASAILTFLFCFMSFPIVLAFGIVAYKTLEVQIWYSFKEANFGEASSLVLIQILITIVLAISYIKLARVSDGESAPTATIRTTSLAKYKSWEKSVIAIYIVLVLILIGGPIVSIFRAAFFDPISQRISLDGFSYLITLGSNGGLEPLINSLFYGGMATLLSIIIGIPLAYAHRSKSRGLPSLSSIMVLLPLGISSITVAYGLLTVIAVPTGLNINPWPIIVIAQTIIGLPFTTRSIEIGLKSIDSNILDQADSLGASRLQRLFFVEIPLLIPSILVGAVFAFAMAIGEMSATLFIALPQNYTLAVAIYHNLGVRRFVDAGASALILVAICVMAFLAMERISKGSTGGTL